MNDRPKSDKPKTEKIVDEAVELVEDDLNGISGGPVFAKYDGVDGESLKSTSYKIGDIRSADIQKSALNNLAQKVRR